MSRYSNEILDRLSLVLLVALLLAGFLSRCTGP